MDDLVETCKHSKGGIFFSTSSPPLCSLQRHTSRLALADLFLAFKVAGCVSTCAICMAPGCSVI